MTTNWPPFRPEYRARVGGIVKSRNGITGQNGIKRQSRMPFG
jgi:hypothetical protein